MEERALPQECSTSPEASEITRSISDLRNRLPTNPLYQEDFTVTDELPTGSTIASIYQSENQTRWMGKIGVARELLYLNPSCETTIRKANLGAVLEKVAADLFYILGESAFKTPLTCLSVQRTQDKCTRQNVLAMPLCRLRNATSIRCMSQFVKDYQDLRRAQTELNGHKLTMIEFLKQYSRPPENIYTPQGDLVPLRGIMELLAAIKILADIDGLGANAGNAGFVWETDENNIITCARVVKIDPGFAFQLYPDPSIGPTVNTILIQAQSAHDYNNLKDIQVVSRDNSFKIKWLSLTEIQKQQFSTALARMIRILLQSDEDLLFCFYRQGAFNQPRHIPLSQTNAQSLISSLKKWINLQTKIYDD